MKPRAGGCPRPQPLPKRLIPGEPSWLANAPTWLLRGAGGGDAPRAAEELRLALASWTRGETCSICGRRAETAAGAWVLSASGDQGVAVLEALVPLCQACRLSYWPGEAAEKGLLVEARRRYTRHCGNRESFDAALQEEARLAHVEEWRISLRVLDGLAERLRVLEEVANHFSRAPWVPGWDSIAALGARADKAALHAASEWRSMICGNSDWPRATLEAARRSLLHVEEAALEKLARWLMDMGICGKPPHQALEMLEGYWVAALTPEDAEKLVASRVLDTAPWMRLELPLRGVLALQAWTPVAVDAAAAAETVSFLEELLGHALDAVYRHAATGAILYATGETR